MAKKDKKRVVTKSNGLEKKDIFNVQNCFKPGLLKFKKFGKLQLEHNGLLKKMH